MSSETPLPSSGPEREIFLRALGRMSEECESPGLIAECPFSIDIPEEPGRRGCGEECLVILRTYGAPSAVDEIPLGSSGITARRVPPMKTSQRKRPQVDRPFDAAEIYYRDSDTPYRHRKTVSLLYEFHERLLSTPKEGFEDERVAVLNQCASELQRRDFNIVPLVRYAYDELIAISVATSLVMPSLVERQESQQELEPALPVAPPGWNQLLDAVLGIDSTSVSEVPPTLSDEEKLAVTRLLRTLGGTFMKYLTHWVSTAPLPDILAWKPPTVDSFIDPAALTSRLHTKQRHIQRWMVDRFIRAYLDDWANESLLLEWQFIQGSETPPCPIEEMSAREVDPSALSQAIANRSSDRSRQNDTADSLKGTALRFLREGRRSSAAGVFEAARDLDQTDAEAHNNYGFCLLPDRPEEALHALQQADELGFPHKTLNRANRMLALSMLGRDAAALELAERVVDEWDTERRTRTYYMWDISSVVLDVALKIAERNGEPVQTRWRRI